MRIGFEERLRSLNTPGMVAKGVPRPALKKIIAAPPRPAPQNTIAAQPRPAPPVEVVKLRGVCGAK